MLLLAAACLCIGHAILQEKLLLIFLLFRPTIDYWRDVTVFTYHSTAINVNAIISLAFALWSLFMLVRHRRNLSQIPALPLAACFGFLMFASALWSVSPFATIAEAIKWFAAVALFSLAFLFAKKRILSPKELTATILFSTGIPILFGLIQLFQNTGLSTFDVHGRIYGSLAHPNVFAFLLVAAIILWIDYGKKFPRSVRVGELIFFTTLLLFTYTRAAYIGLLVFFIVLGLMQYKQLFFLPPQAVVIFPQNHLS